MFPREHGAYGQLLFPLATALAIGRPGWAALVLVGAMLAAFVAHEPLLVLLGHRGVRAAREKRGEAWRWFAGCGTVAAALGVAGVVLMPDGTRASVAGPAALAAVLAIVIARGQEHTTGGEIVSAVTMASLSLPVARAGGTSEADALTCALVFASAFVVATVSVRVVITWMRHALGRWARALTSLFAAGVVLALAWTAHAGGVNAAAPWAALPVCGVGFVLAAAAPPPKHVRRIGWILVAATTIEAGVLIGALR